jgi:hypothetical protein
MVFLSWRIHTCLSSNTCKAQMDDLYPDERRVQKVNYQE